MYQAYIQVDFINSKILSQEMYGLFEVIMKTNLKRSIDLDI